MMTRWLGAVGLIAVAACGPSIGDSGGGGDGGAGGPDSGGPRADARPPAQVAYVYAHSSSELYRVDPDTLAVGLVGPFGWPTVVDSMTDIAIDRDGNMVGISFDRVYAVNTDTAACTYLADLDRQFNGLSFVPASEVDPTGAERLVAAALDGSLYEINPATGASTPVGSYGVNLGSSGDMVSVIGFGTVATVKEGAAGTDKLARIDLATGAATLIGDTGVTNIWGLGFWRGQVFGFTSLNQFVLIDATTGLATPVETGNVSWWGAAVTTAAPVIP